MSAGVSRRMAVLSLLAPLGIAACDLPMTREWAEYGVGRRLSDIEALDRSPDSYARRAGRTPTSYVLPSGHRVYIHPARPDCDVHYEANADGIVIEYRTRGAACRHE